jgi:hypothetical protein
MLLKKAIVALLVAGCVPSAIAQGHGGGHGAGFAPGFARGFGVPGWRAGFARAFYYGDPYFYSDYSDYSEYPTPPGSPQIILVQPAPPAVAQPEAKVEPLMIELQGDRYVRIGGASSQDESAPVSGSQAAASPKTTPVVTSAQTSPTHPAAPLPPALLIYRDGHSEQVPDYAIAGGVIYARGDYWQQGYWTKSIQLSALNIPATIQANQEKGVNFVLPSAPNEVVTRP